MEINKLIKEAHENAEKHGFWDDINLLSLLNISEGSSSYKKLKNNAIGNRLMLIVSELTEAQDGLRHNDMDNFKEELADTCIRIFDLCGGLDIDLESEIEKKMEKNMDRPYMHGKEF